MAYPESVDNFYQKLNKKPDDSVYVIEEQLQMAGGKYEGLLVHDNINNATIRVYSGPKLTGEVLTNFTISIPAETPWKRYIKIFSDSTTFVTYETQGDTVEADDVNALQESVRATQIEINRYKQEGHIDGGTF